MRYGVISHQGDFSLHQSLLSKMNREAVKVLTLDDLNSVDALIIPGGESTTLIKFFDKLSLWEPIKSKIEKGMPVFGTCAGLILLAKEIVNSRQQSLELLDISVIRNGYGRQVASFEAPVESPLFGKKPINGIFIRAPKITRCGKSVDVLARYNDDPVLVRSNNILGATFHPELSGDKKVHEIFISMVESKN